MTDTGPVPTQLFAPPLTLRPWRDGDAPALAEAVRESMDSLSRFMPWCHPDYDVEEARQWTLRCQAEWRSGGMYDFAVIGAQDRVLGSVGLNQIDYRDRRANLGYWIRESSRGHGFIARAAHAVATFGFGTLALQRIEIVTALDNLASQRCAEKIGARQEGITRHRIWQHDQAHDAVVYGLVPEDLDQPAAHQRAISS